MTIERSRGKARPTLPRASDLQPVGTAPDPSEGRNTTGRFAKGNQLSRGSGTKHVVTKALSVAGLQADVALVVADCRKLFSGALRELPSSGSIVRSNAYGYAREASLAGYYDTKANEAGLDTERGMMLADRATHHRQRAERLGVTTVDLATRLAATQRLPRPIDVETRFAAAEQRLREHQAAAASVEASDGDDDEPADGIDEGEASEPEPETPKTRERGAQEPLPATPSSPPTPVRIPATPPLHPLAAAAEQEHANRERMKAEARERDRHGTGMQSTSLRWCVARKQWVPR